MSRFDSIKASLPGRKEMLGAAALAAAIFVFDLAVPLGVAGGVPYVMLVLLGLRSGNWQFTFALAGLGTVLTVLGYFLSPAGGEPWVVLTNRGLAIFAIWISALLGVRLAGRAELAEGDVETLTGVNSALREEIERRLSAEQKLTGILDIAIEAVVTVDADQIIQLFSRGAERVFGYAAKEVIGQPLTMLIPERFHRTHPVHVAAFQEMDKPRAMGHTRPEIVGLRKDGTEFPAEASIVRLDVAGEHLFTATLRDLSEKKEAEEAILREKAQAAEYLDIAGSMIVALNPAGMVTLANRAACEALGYSASELIGRKWIATVAPPEERDNREEAFKNWFQGDHPPFTSTISIITRSSELLRTRWNNRPIWGGDGRIVGALCSGEDITEQEKASEQLKSEIAERKKAEAEVVEQSRLLEMLFRHTHSAFALLDRQFNFIRVNEAYARADDKDVGFFPGKNHFDLYPGPDVEASFREVRDSGEPMFVEARPFEYRDHPDWGTTYWDFSVIPVPDETGRTEFIVFTLNDVTQRERAQQARREALVAAREASDAKSNFLASMSHELRTPLNAILGFSDVLKNERMGPLGEKKYVEYAGDIHASAGHLLSLVNDLLDISAIEAGKHKVAIEAINTADIATDCLRLVANDAEKTGIVLVTDLPEELPDIAADRRAVKQVLLNLLTNAVKFTPSGGKVSVSATAVDDLVRIQVSDTGEGIPVDKLPELTNPFTRVEKDPHKKVEGWGLGLAIIKALMELQDGELEIESEVGEGTTVTVTFPVAKPSTGRRPALKVV